MAVHARVERRGDRPVLVLNGRVEPPLLYALTDCPGSRWSWEEVPARGIAQFAAAGLRLFQVDLWFEQLFGPDGSFNLELARRQVGGVLAVAPAASVMIRLHVNAPDWWCEAHPEECVGYADTTPDPSRPWGLVRPLAGDLGQPRRASFHSRVWLGWAQGCLERFSRELAATPEGGAVFALQVANGVYGEWHQWGFFRHEPDVGPAATRALAAWARGAYGSVDALNRAWRAGLQEFDAVRPPGLEERAAAAAGGLLRDPATQRSVTDYYRFLHAETADAILALARTIRRSWPREIVTASFYGYFYSGFGRLAAGGHLALAQVLASPDLDCLCSPHSYRPAARELGGTGQPRGLLGPVLRAGKLWLDEMDECTSVGGCPWLPDFRSTTERDTALLRRNVLHPVTRGGGLWWYDFGPNNASTNFAVYGLRGTWDEPDLQAEIARLTALAGRRAEMPLARPADVWVAHDPAGLALVAGRPLSPGEAAGVYPVAPGDFVSPYAVDGLAEGLHRSGLIHDEVLLHELWDLDWSACRWLIFATALELTLADRVRLRARLAEFAGHVLFCGPCGWSDGQSAGPSLGGEVAPFAPALQTAATARIDFAVGGVHASIELPPNAPAVVFGQPGEVMARWANGGAAGGRREVGRRVEWAFAVAPTDPALLRELGRQAGAAVLNAGEDTTLAGAGLLVVHTREGGPRTLRLPNGRIVETVLPPCSTRAFDLDTGEVLLA